MLQTALSHHLLTGTHAHEGHSAYIRQKLKSHIKGRTRSLQDITVNQHNTDLQPWLLTGSQVFYMQGPAGGSGWACRQSGVSMGPGSARWHVSVWLVGLTVHCMTDSHRHAQTAARADPAVNWHQVRKQRQGERGREPKGAIYKKIRFRRLVSLAAHKASTLQVTEMEKIAYLLSGTSASYR